METQPFKQKVYDVAIALTRTVGGQPLHTVPLTGITKDELKFLSFVHGGDAIVPNTIKYRGEQVVMMSARAGEDSEKRGQEIQVPVQSQMQEYVRIVRKYDMNSELVGLGKARDRVEACFRVRLDDFDENVLMAADPITIAEEAAVRAELESQAVEMRELEKATRPDKVAA